MAYTVIYFIRLLVPFSKKDLDSQTEIPGSTSYVAIDVHDDTSPCENKPVSLINSDQRKIIDMVKKKEPCNFETIGRSFESCYHS